MKSNLLLLLLFVGCYSATKAQTTDSLHYRYTNSTLYRKGNYFIMGVLTPDEICEVLQRESLPVLTQPGSWMKEQYVQTLPKSALGKALGYSI